MADDLDKPYEYPFEIPSEEEIKFGVGAIDGKPAGVPSSYDEGGSTRWTPDAIAEVHALAQLGRYQVRGYNTCLLYTSPSPRDLSTSRMPSSA